MSASLKDHIEKLPAFVAVARTGSFHAAAQRLRLSQPTISVAIRILEEALEAPLFIRSVKGVQLTRAGEKLLAFSERLISEVEGIEDRIRRPEDPMSGHLRIGTFESLAIHFWPRFLGELRERFPHLRVSLSTHKTGELLAGLESRRLHLVVGSEPDTRKGVDTETLYEDEFLFFRSPQMEKPETPPLIYVPAARVDSGETLEQLLSRLDFDPGPLFEVDTFESARALTKEGLGLGLLPKRSVRQDLREGALRSTTVAKLPSHFGRHHISISALVEDRQDPLLMRVKSELSRFAKKSEI